MPRIGDTLHTNEGDTIVVLSLTKNGVRIANGNMYSLPNTAPRPFPVGATGYDWQRGRFYSISSRRWWLEDNP